MSICLLPCWRNSHIPVVQVSLRGRICHQKRRKRLRLQSGRRAMVVGFHGYVIVLFLQQSAELTQNNRHRTARQLQPTLPRVCRLVLRS